MKRILLMVLRNIVFVPYWWIKLCWYAAHTDDYPEEKKYAFLRLVDEHAIEGGNIHIDICIKPLLIRLTLAMEVHCPFFWSLNVW